MDSQLLTLSSAKALYSELPASSQIPSLDPRYVTADSARASYLCPKYWTYSSDSHFSLRSFHQVRTELTDPTLCVRHIEYPYGYGGVLSSTIDPVFLSNERKCFREWASNNNILLEFCRLHPLLPDQSHSYEYIDFNRCVVSIDLTSDFFGTYRQTVRNSIRKDLKKNLQLTCSNAAQNIDIFLSLYTQTMKRLRSSPFYHFPRTYFIKLLTSANAKLWTLSYDEIPKSAAIILENKYSGIAEYHLGAYETLPGAQPMLSILHLISLAYASKEFNTFYLGGGRSTQQDDSLLRFKQGISNLSHRFFIGSSIFNQSSYSELKSMMPKSHQSDRIIFYRD